MTDAAKATGPASDAESPKPIEPARLPSEPPPIRAWYKTDWALCVFAAVMPFVAAAATPTEGTLSATAQVAALGVACLFLGIPLLVQTRAARALSFIHAQREASRRSGDLPSSSQVIVASAGARRPLPPGTARMIVATAVPLVVGLLACAIALSVWPHVWGKFGGGSHPAPEAMLFLAAFALWPTVLSMVGAFRVLGQHRHRRVMESRHMMQALLSQILWGLAPPIVATSSSLALLRYAVELGSFSLAAAVGGLMLFSTTLLVWLTWRYSEKPL